MPLRSNIPARMSARAVYARKAEQEKVVKKGRGRPRKIPQPLNDISPKRRKTTVKKPQKSKVRKSRGNVENNSSEADCSSEDEEEDIDETASDTDDKEDSHEEINNEDDDIEEESVDVENESEEYSGNDEDDIITDEDVMGPTDDEDVTNDDDSDEENVRYSINPSKMLSLTTKKNINETDKRKKENVAPLNSTSNVEQKKRKTKLQNVNDKPERQQSSPNKNKSEDLAMEIQTSPNKQKKAFTSSIEGRSSYSSLNKQKEESVASNKQQLDQLGSSKQMKDLVNLAEKQSFRPSPNKEKTDIITEKQSNRLGSSNEMEDSKSPAEKMSIHLNENKQKHDEIVALNKNVSLDGQYTDSDNVNSTLLKDSTIPDGLQRWETNMRDKQKLKRKVMLNLSSDEIDDSGERNITDSRRRRKKIKMERRRVERHRTASNNFGNASVIHPQFTPTISGQISQSLCHNKQAHSFDPSSLSSDTVTSLVRLNRSSSCGNAASEEAFRWLINPLQPNLFFDDIFEQMPYHVTRRKKFYYIELFNVSDLNTMLKENNLEYDVHIDVVKYVDGERIPAEASGRAYCSNVWDDYKQGNSVRVRNPQTYNKNLWNLCALLQEYFSSTVGVNMYLTPPNAQGFPPHYDDVDAFITQIEGTKHWKVYEPRNDSEDLARYSSRDFNQDEIGEPILEISLKPGDMLYIPRGYIHQASTESCHSLHLTFSTNQCNTWGDLLLPAMQKAMERAILNDVEFRKAVPRNFMNYAGASVPETENFHRHEFQFKLGRLASKCLDYIDANEAADTHALRYIRCSLPPAFNKIEMQRSLHGNGNSWKNGDVQLKSSLTLDTEIQLIRKRNMRLVMDGTVPKVYHNLENTRDPKGLEDEGVEGVYIEFAMEGVPAFTHLLDAHPEFVKIRDLPIEDPEDRVFFATSLYENGVLMTKKPLPVVTDDVDWGYVPRELPVKREERF